MRNKTVLITGGATGIGKMTALHFAKKGFDLVINYRSSTEAAESLKASLTKAYGINCLLVQGDICKKEDCERIAAFAKENFPAVDILIHNAGPYIHERKRMTDYTYEEWNEIFSGNLTSVFYLSKLLLPGMRTKGWGRIITIGYDRAETAPGWIYRSAFAAAKTGLASLTKTIAMEEAENGITANMVSPGDIVAEWKEKEIAAAIADPETNAPVGRYGTGEDIARVIAFLAEEQSSFITGSVIPVTGGLDVLGKFYSN
ncbi:SDR family oxidoreductase [Bacillus sp. B-jedd]|uniref:SDR family oxidoreductase n=1 Tax=Bacillus sp. B-jedd TaxID=1476857 RepID=UPI0005155E5A|nr:SDR family oxidoreductase [Bacillus sp. B-jedd]CEG27520.1 3-ketoacyl-ACP reductase [Bacillus sp. B-jedd]